MSPRARLDHPATSHAAATNISNVSRLQGRILALLLHYGPLADHELVAHYQVHVAEHNFPPASDSGIRSRRHELADAGRIHRTHSHTLTAGGNRASVWAVPPIPQQRAA